VLIPDESLSGLLESAPANKRDASDRRLKGCGRCLVAGLLQCRLRDGVGAITVRSIRAVRFYENLGFVHLGSGVLSINAEEASRLISSVMNTGVAP
jgi:hypothetical protein